MLAQYLGTLQKTHDFERPYRQWVFGVKSLVLKKYPKISTGVKPAIVIQCRPKILALFINPKILIRKIRPWGFLAAKNMVLTKYPKILTGANLRFRYDVSPISLYFLKVPRLWQTKQGMGFCRQETWFLWNNRRFWKVLKLGFGYDVGPISWYSLKNPRFRQATQAM